MRTALLPTLFLLGAAGAVCAQEAPKDPDPETFVVLAISGGGARASSFGLGALQTLREIKVKDTSLLDHVDVVSGTSGGALVATQVALDRSPEGVAAFRKAALETNVSKAWKRSIVKNSAKLLKKGLSRADLMARIVGGFYGDRSWEDLPGRPSLFLTTVDMGTGKLFPWTATSLKAHGYAPKDLPLGRTATASMAPPGAMLPLEFALPKGEPVQLMDGGVVDNMALSSFLMAEIPKGTKRVLVIAVNARRSYQPATKKEATLQSSKRQPEILQLRIDDLMRDAVRSRLKLLEAQAELAKAPIRTAFVEVAFAGSKRFKKLDAIKTWFTIDAKLVKLAEEEGAAQTQAKRDALLAPFGK